MKLAQHAIGLLFGLLILLPLPVKAADWLIDSFDSQITIQADGALAVRETIAVDFQKKAKHGIFRTIPYRYQQSSGEVYTKIDDIAITQDGQQAEYDRDRSDGNIVLKIGDLDQTITGKHIYVISYQVSGVLRGFDAYDELYWNATGNEWETSIAQATATVSLPQTGIIQTACYQWAVGSNDSCQIAGQDHKTVSFRASTPLDSGEGMTVAVGYMKGMVPLLTVSAPPNPLTVAFSPLTAVTALAILGVSLFLILRAWWRFGRDQHDGRTTIVAEYTAPGKLRPAEMGVLLDERADTLDVSATIVDLANRGFLSITEQPKKWLLGETDYLFERQSKAETGLMAYEIKLLNALFQEDKTVKLSELKYTFYEDLQVIKDLIYAEVTAKQLFIANPHTVRSRYLAAGLITAFLAVALLIATAVLIERFTNLIYAQLLFGGGAGFLVAGVILAAMSNAMPARTTHGRELYRQIKGFELFINTAEKYRAQFAEKENLFTEILPYAIVFKATKKLAKAMKKLELEPPQPVWYHGVHPFHTIAFASTIDTFSNTIGTAMAATPGSSGSAGGGFSGGGFGGGGGGSW